LEAVGQAADWYRRARIGGTENHGIWARFYELGTNRPLYFTRTYKLVYSDDDLPVHYSFQGNWGVDAILQRYDALKKRGRNYYLKQRARQKTAAQWAALARSVAPKVRKIIETQDELGRWVHVVAKREQLRDKQGRVSYQTDPSIKLAMMYSNEFCQNMRALATYITAAQGGPVKQ